jgi:hypothetical protein
VEERHFDFRTTLPAPPAQDLKYQHVLAEVEERLGFGANLVAPDLLEILMPFPYSIVPVIGGTADRSKID